jgi:hypothetical protein
MHRSTFDDAMKWLRKHFQAEQAHDDRVENIWLFFADVDDDVFIAAVNLMIKDLQAFPTLAQAADAVATSKETVEAKQKKKQAAEKKTRVEYQIPKVNTEMGRRAVELMDRRKLPETDPKRLTAKQLAIAMITEMEAEFPNNGWEEEGRRLLDWIEKRPAVEEKRQASIFVERQSKIR